jgi:hypothetical protein
VVQRISHEGITIPDLLITVDKLLELVQKVHQYH